MNKLYFETADILERALSKERNLRTLVYNSHFKNKKLLLRLCCETLKYRPYLEKVLNATGVRKILNLAGINGNRSLALVLLYEFLLGRSFAKVGDPLKSIILSVEKEIRLQESHLSEVGETPESVKIESVSNIIPRYARINSVLTSPELAIEELENLGWTVGKIKRHASMKRFKKKVREMELQTIYKDPHIDNLLIFRPGTDLHENPLVLDGRLVLQDKASCLSAFLLNPTPSSVVFDVCAAPGMKTSHLSALMENRGKIYAFDRDRNRAAELENTIHRLGVSIAQAIHMDFLKVDVYEKKFAKVKFAIVDPPCSGSGMAKRLDFMESVENVDERRLKSLSNLQSMILKHALKLPNLERLVYSTCSIHEAENEKVVAEAISDPVISGRFELVHAFPEWKHRGLSSTYEFGEKCLRADPQTDLTNGFFVALFQARK
uniref:SAM-dependent MTase RsmB/NOP-type domain-containing protein n=1 Tax=Acrobeloides nanus TaxID=290746 RepID=A0A914DWM8_9BILA